MDLTDDSLITLVAVRSVLARHGANVRAQTVEGKKDQQPDKESPGIEEGKKGQQLDKGSPAIEEGKKDQLPDKGSPGIDEGKKGQQLDKESPAKCKPKMPVLGQNSAKLQEAGF